MFLLSAGLAALRRSQFYNESEEYMEPLEGVADGGRRTFFTASKPLVYDPTGAFGAVATLAVYDASENIVPSSLYTLASQRAGALQFKTPPTLGGVPNAPLFCSYTWADLDLQRLYGCLMDGFSEMEQRFPRGFSLSPQASTTTPIPGQLDLAVVDSNGADPVGPGNTTFSGSIFQLNLLGICAAYRLHRDYIGAQSKSAYRYREGRMGMEVDPTPALKLASDYLKEISAQMMATAERAQEDWYAGTGGVGTAILNPTSQGYDALFDWRTPGSTTASGVAFASPYGGVVY